MVKRRTHNSRSAGSIPAGATKFILIKKCVYRINKYNGDMLCYAIMDAVKTQSTN
jgi:hypothetical protein